MKKYIKPVFVLFYRVTKSDIFVTSEIGHSLLYPYALSECPNFLSISRTLEKKVKTAKSIFFRLPKNQILGFGPFFQHPITTLGNIFWSIFFCHVGGNKGAEMYRENQGPRYSIRLSREGHFYLGVMYYFNTLDQICEICILNTPYTFRVTQPIHYILNFQLLWLYSASLVS